MCLSALVKGAGRSAQFHQLQLYRHEMQHFVKVIQGYIANQILQVSWSEFHTQTEQRNDPGRHSPHARRVPQQSHLQVSTRHTFSVHAQISGAGYGDAMVLSVLSQGFADGESRPVMNIIHSISA